MAGRSGMRLYYILAEDGKTPIATQDLMLWAGFMQKGPVHVADTRDEEQGVRVSTVFLSLDHNHSGIGPPILFETMVFGGKNSERMWRYTTWEEAERGHKVACGIAGVAWGNFDTGTMSA